MVHLLRKRGRRMSRSECVCPPCRPMRWCWRFAVYTNTNLQCEPATWSKFTVDRGSRGSQVLRGQGRLARGEGGHSHVAAGVAGEDRRLAVRRLRQGVGARLAYAFSIGTDGQPRRQVASYQCHDQKQTDGGLDSKPRCYSKVGDVGHDRLFLTFSRHLNPLRAGSQLKAIKIKMV